MNLWLFLFFVQTFSEEAHGKDSFMATIIIQRSASSSHQNLFFIVVSSLIKKNGTFNISPNLKHLDGSIGLVKCVRCNICCVSWKITGLRRIPKVIVATSIPKNYLEVIIIMLFDCCFFRRTTPATKSNSRNMSRKISFFHAKEQSVTSLKNKDFNSLWTCWYSWYKLGKCFVVFMFMFAMDK